jgi:hypothetical protein
LIRPSSSAWKDCLPWSICTLPALADTA